MKQEVKVGQVWFSKQCDSVAIQIISANTDRIWAAYICEPFLDIDEICPTDEFFKYFELQIDLPEESFSHENEVPFEKPLDYKTLTAHKASKHPFLLDGSSAPSVTIREQCNCDITSLLIAGCTKHL